MFILNSIHLIIWIKHIDCSEFHLIFTPVKFLREDSSRSISTDITATVDRKLRIETDFQKYFQQKFVVCQHAMPPNMSVGCRHIISSSSTSSLERGQLFSI